MNTIGYFYFNIYNYEYKHKGNAVFAAFRVRKHSVYALCKSQNIPMRLPYYDIKHVYRQIDGTP